jgi:hypothetical protein
MSEATPGIPAVAMTTGLAAERPTTDVPIYGALVGQDKALASLEDLVNRLLTTLRGTEYGARTDGGINETPPGAISASVTNVATRVLANNEVIETVSRQVDEITDELCRTRVGIGI